MYGCVYHVCVHLGRQAGRPHTTHQYRQTDRQTDKVGLGKRTRRIHTTHNIHLKKAAFSRHTGVYAAPTIRDGRIPSVYAHPHGQAGRQAGREGGREGERGEIDVALERPRTWQQQESEEKREPALTARRQTDRQTDRAYTPTHSPLLPAMQSLKIRGAVMSVCGTSNSLSLQNAPTYHPCSL